MSPQGRIEQDGKLAICEFETPFLIDQASIGPHITKNNNLFIACSSYRPCDTQLLDLYKFEAQEGKFSLISRFGLPFPVTKIQWALAKELSEELCFLTLSDTIKLYKNGKHIQTLPTPTFKETNLKSKNHTDDIICPYLGSDWSKINPHHILSTGIDGKVTKWDLKSNSHVDVVKAISSSLLSPKSFPQATNNENSYTSQISSSNSPLKKVLDSRVMPVCDVKYGSTDHIIAISLGNGDLYLIDDREPLYPLTIDSPPKLEFSTLSWLHTPASDQYIMQLNQRTSSLSIHDMRQLSTSKASNKKIPFDISPNKSIVSALVNPLKPTNLLTAYEEGVVEIWDIPQFLGRSPQSDSQLAIKGVYDVNSVPNIRPNTNWYSRNMITAFDIAHTGYQGKNSRSVQVAAIALCPSQISSRQTSNYYSTDENSNIKQPSGLNYSYTDFMENPKLQLIRID